MEVVNEWWHNIEPKDAIEKPRGKVAEFLVKKGIS